MPSDFFGSDRACLNICLSWRSLAVNSLSGTSRSSRPLGSCESTTSIVFNTQTAARLFFEASDRTIVPLSKSNANRSFLPHAASPTFFQGNRSTNMEWNTRRVRH